jgi:hypothetical protein
VVTLAGDPTRLRELTGRSHDIALHDTLEWMFSATA